MVLHCCFCVELISVNPSLMFGQFRSWFTYFFPVFEFTFKSVFFTSPHNLFLASSLLVLVCTYCSLPVYQTVLNNSFIFWWFTLPTSTSPCIREASDVHPVDVNFRYLLLPVLCHLSHVYGTFFLLEQLSVQSHRSCFCLSPVLHPHHMTSPAKYFSLLSLLLTVNLEVPYASHVGVPFCICNRSIVTQYLPVSFVPPTLGSLDFPRGLIKYCCCSRIPKRSQQHASTNLACIFFDNLESFSGIFSQYHSPMALLIMFVTFSGPI